MYPLRLRILWMAAGAFGISLLIYLSLSQAPGAVLNHGAVMVHKMRLCIPSDKGCHFAVYLLLMLWFCQICRHRNHFYVATGLMALGLILEITQGTLAYRSSDLADVLANVFGIAAGWTAARTLLFGGLWQFERRFLNQRRSFVLKFFPA